MSIEGLWHVDWECEDGYGVEKSGVMVFETGRLLGGDDAYIYLGEYEIQEGGNFQLKLKIKKHHGSRENLLGLGDEFELNMRMRPARKDSELPEIGDYVAVGHEIKDTVKENAIFLVLTKIEELP